MKDHFLIEAEVGEFQKNTTQIIKGRLVVAYGFPCADVRIFEPDVSGGLRHTYRGFSIPRRKLPELKRLVEKLIAAAGQEGDGVAASQGEGRADEEGEGHE